MPAFHLPAGTPASATGGELFAESGNGGTQKCRLLIGF